MTPIEKYMFWACMISYMAAASFYINALVFNIERSSKIGFIAMCAGLAAHTVAILDRWMETGHVPTIGNYENALAGAWFIILFTIIAGLVRSQAKNIAAGTVSLSLILLAFGVFSGAEKTTMVAALNSIWLYIHISFAWLSYGAYTLAFGSGLAYIIRLKRESRGQDLGMAAKLPDLEALDELTFRYIAFGFIADVVMIAAGSIWAKDLWGTYWGWDPVEIWSLISWLVYGVAIHLRLTMRWKGKKFAWYAVVAIITVIIAYWGVNFFVESSEHTFNVR